VPKKKEKPHNKLEKKNKEDTNSEKKMSGAGTLSPQSGWLSQSSTCSWHGLNQKKNNERD
jgi:hypothetical protein